jgi:hypothetical protein
VVVVDKEDNGAREARPDESRSQVRPDQTQINSRAAAPPTPTQNTAAPNSARARLAGMLPTNVKIGFSAKAKQAVQTKVAAIDKVADDPKPESSNPAAGKWSNLA